MAAFLLICELVYLDLTNETICALWFVALHTPSLVGIASTAQIAIIRSVKIPFQEVTNARRGLRARVCL